MRFLLHTIDEQICLAAVMGVLLEEAISRSKKPLICGYVKQAILIFGDDVLHLLSHSSADADGHAQFEGHTVSCTFSVDLFLFHCDP